MFSKEEIKKLQKTVEELSEKIDKISEKQNSQFTDIMLQLKESGKVFYSQDDGDEEGIEDSLYEEAKNMVIASGKASTSWLQRKLGIGYSRSAKLMDTLEQEKVVGPANGSNPREILLKQ